METRSEYFDQIAESYSRSLTETMPVRAYSEIYSLLFLLGDIRGRSILDVGCSDGLFTRTLKAAGAGRTVGVDLSPRMIELAKTQEAEESLGIEYLCADAADLPLLGPCDMIIAPFLLNFAVSTAMLEQFSSALLRNLAPGGRAVFMVDHPELRPDRELDFRRYGTIKEFEPPPRDEAPLEITLFVGGKQDGETRAIRFTGVYYSRTTLEAAVRRAGPFGVSWHEPLVSPSGTARFGPAFWHDYLTWPTTAFMVVTGE